ncbi:MAG TPA: RDD family protein [Thermoanaerobaculia bacterium]|nr:RDD family protein [Thermoanaerobaculia bacterium]
MSAPDDLAPDLGTVLSLDNVPVELPVARVGSRVLAAVVDYAALFVLLIGWTVGIVMLATGLKLRPGWGIAAWLLGAFAFEYGYFAAQEILFDGRTLGKRLFGLRVVARDGAAAGNGALLVRNLVRLLDVLFGVLLMALDPLSRRLGDRLAGTLVVHQSEEAPELLLNRLPAGWGAAEARLVESYLRRAGELEPEARLQLARRFERWVDERSPGFLAGAPGVDPLGRLWHGFRGAPAPGELPSER